MTEIRIGSKECPIEDFLEIIKAQNTKQINLGWFSEWVTFAGCLNLPPDVMESFIDEVSQNGKPNHTVIKSILAHWIKHNPDNANLGTVLNMVERHFEWTILTNFLRDKIQTFAENHNDLDEKSLEQLLILPFSFLGRQTSLKALKSLVSKESFDDICSSIDNIFIVRVLQGKMRKFDDFCLPSEVSNYANRTVQIRQKINPEIFKNACKDVFVFEDTLPYDLSILVRPQTADVSGGQLKSRTVRFILLESEEDFPKIVQGSTYPVHRIQYKENSYFWKRSFKSINVIREFITDDVKKVNEDQIINDAHLKLDSKPVLICGGPGTGKSALLASLANQIFQRHPERYIIFTSFPHMIPRHGEKQDYAYQTSSLGKIFGSVFTMDKFAKTILEGLMKNKETNFDIFLDGIDEVPSKHISQAKLFLTLLLEYPNLRIYMSVGPTLRQELENHLNVLSYDIVSLDQDEMKSMLSKRVNSLECQTVLKSLSFIEENNQLPMETAGKPLQCFMLSEVYSESTTKKFNVSRDFYWSKCPIKSITELYNRYMDIKFSHLKEHDTKLLKLLHYKQAFNNLFYGSTNAEYIIQALDKQIHQYTISSKPDCALFEHTTFSEYLVAEFIFQNLKELTFINEEIFSLFIYETLLVTCKSGTSDENSERFSDMEIDTLKSVDFGLGTERSEYRDAVARLIKLGWGLTLKNLQTSILKGKLDFRHSAICYFLNDRISNDDSMTLERSMKGSFKVCQDSNSQFGMISKDFLAKILVSVKQGYKYLFWLATELHKKTTKIETSYINSQTCQTILILAARHDDITTFQHFSKLVEINSGADITSIKFHCDILQNMVYEHTPLHEAAKRGNYILFEHLFNVLRNKGHSLTGLVQICLSGSSKNSLDVIKNKNKILRLLSSENIKYRFKNIESSLLDGIHVTLFTKLCDMVGYTLSGKDVKWLYKYVVHYFTKEAEMDIFVNWLISKDLARLLLYFEEGWDHLIINALQQNVLSPQSLENVYISLPFDLGSIMFYVKNCKNRLHLMKKICDLIGNVSEEDENDPIILQWAVSMYECDPLRFVLFERSQRVYKNQKPTKLKMEQLKKCYQEIQSLIRETKLNREKLPAEHIFYNSDEILGKGSFGTVYRGTLNDRPVAVKKVDYKPEQEYQVDEETKILLECSNHENIIKCFYVEQCTETVLIALEICNWTLEEWVKNPSEKSKVNSKRLLYQATEGLKYLHSLDIVHLDITPRNILVTLISDDDVRVKIIDFGNSRKLTDNTNRQIEHGAGTIEWMAPELIQIAKGKNHLCLNLSASADMYSLGCVFYYVLTIGIHPFGASEADIVSNIQHNKPCVNIGDLKDPLCVNLFFLMTNPNPDIRPTAAALLHHHIFWPEKTMLSFLVTVSNAADTPTITSDMSKIMDQIENYDLLKPYYEPENSRGWVRFLCSDVKDYVSGNGCKRKPYMGDLFFDLVRAIRNMQAHFIALPKNVQMAVGQVPNSFMRYWLKRFAIIFEIIWLNFEALKKDTSTGLSEYYCEEFDFYCESVSKQADSILTKIIKKQCAKMVLNGTKF